MICPVCGIQLPDTATQCYNCGKPFSKVGYSELNQSQYVNQGTPAMIYSDPDMKYTDLVDTGAKYDKPKTAEYVNQGVQYDKPKTAEYMNQGAPGAQYDKPKTAEYVNQGAPRAQYDKPKTAEYVNQGAPGTQYDKPKTAEYVNQGAPGMVYNEPEADRDIVGPYVRQNADSTFSGQNAKGSDAQQKGNLTKYLKWIIPTVLAVIILLTAYIAVRLKRNDESSTTSESSTFVQSTTQAYIPHYNDDDDSGEVYNIGDVWTVDGQWSVVILGAKKTEERNSYSSKNPKVVYIVDYVYTNIGYQSNTLNGLYMSIDSNIVDSSGIDGYPYSSGVTYYPQETPAGATCRAQACIGLDNDGIFKITIRQYDVNSQRHSATFIVDPAKEAKDVEMPHVSNVNTEGIAIGETWTVDGQWSVTITGVKETKDRNAYSDKNPAAVYIVDYTYTNIGYKAKYMDGLYLSLDDIVIDSAGVMGYSYPGVDMIYAKETPIGETCKAQACIGVENPGDFSIIVSRYDGNDEKQIGTFLVPVN